MEDDENTIEHDEGDNYQEIWIAFNDAKQSLCALINRELGLGWLHYFAHNDGDPGNSSNNPDHRGDQTAVRFLLNSGQEEEYPRAWCYSVQQVEDAIAYFREHKQRAPFIQWIDNSQFT